MNEHIYIDKGTPIISLIERTLTDGSKVYDLQLREVCLGAISKKAGHEAMIAFAQIIRERTNEQVLHL